MIAGILVFVPYLLGAFTGLLLATLAALLQFGSWQGLFMVWGVLAIGQFLESFFITPQIVGDRIGLSPLGDFLFNGVRPIDGLCGHVGGSAFGGSDAGVAARGCGCLFQKRFLRQEQE